MAVNTTPTSTVRTGQREAAPEEQGALNLQAFESRIFDKNRETH
jgi:hypothetical protein